VVETRSTTIEGLPEVGELLEISRVSESIMEAERELTVPTRIRVHEPYTKENSGLVEEKRKKNFHDPLMKYT
jgi:hypothetical protein